MSSDDLVRQLAAEDPRGAVWCAALCAATVRHLAPPAALPALRLALLWAQGAPVSAERLRAAANAAADAADAAAAHSCAAFATAFATYATHAYVAYAAHAYAVAAWGDDAYAAAASTAAVEGAQLVDHQLTPIDPTGIPERPHAAVLWDWAQDQGLTEPMRTGTLGEALVRARRWWVPHERALAERQSGQPPGPWQGTWVE